MRVDLFDFDLPEQQIALRPLPDRGEAKLLYVPAQGSLADHKVKDLPSLLRSGDILVFNNTKVIPARLYGRRWRGENSVALNVTLLTPTQEGYWRAFVRPLKRLHIGEEIFFEPPFESHHKQKDGLYQDSLLKAKLVEKCPSGEAILSFDMNHNLLQQKLNHYGTMPLPPYIAGRRAADLQDERDYQTIFAKYEGAVASPTAGLHFTPFLLKALAERGIDSAFVTLHVGAGTFFPVKVEDTRLHKMHEEFAFLDEATAQILNQAKAEGRRVVAVGTTALRVLESAATEIGKVAGFEKATDIFITPGYHFRFVDALLTNFHLPRSTLFMLVCAFCGLTRMKEAYRHAIEGNYRFYSYGDTSLLERIAS